MKHALHIANTPNCSHITRRRVARIQPKYLLLALWAALSIGGACLGASTPAFAQAPAGTSGNYIKGHIYLYQPNGQPPLDVTDIYNKYGYVFDANGNPLYILIDSIGQVHDFNSNLIGFVA